MESYENEDVLYMVLRPVRFVWSTDKRFVCASAAFYLLMVPLLGVYLRKVPNATRLLFGMNTPATNELDSLARIGVSACLLIAMPLAAYFVCTAEFLLFGRDFVD